MGRFLYEYLGLPGPLTHREHRTWLAWLRLDMNCPSRSDYYLMQIDFDLRRANVENPKKVLFEDSQLKFNQPVERPKQLTREEAAALSKAQWLGRMTVPVKEVKAEPKHLRNPE